MKNTQKCFKNLWDMRESSNIHVTKISEENKSEWHQTLFENILKKFSKIVKRQ